MSASPLILPRTQVPTSLATSIELEELKAAQANLRIRLADAASAKGWPQLTNDLRFSLNALGCLRIEGRVSSYYLKQMTQELALRDRAVLQVENRLTVSRQADW